MIAQACDLWWPVDTMSQRGWCWEKLLVKAAPAMAGSWPAQGPESEVKLLQRARDLGPGPSLADPFLSTPLLQRRLSWAWPSSIAWVWGLSRQSNLERFLCPGYKY